MYYLLKIKDLIIDTLFPPLCARCEILLTDEEKRGALCKECMGRIRVHTALFCSVCGARLPENKKTCHKNARFILGAATDYDETVRMLIHRLKYGRYTAFSNTLHAIMDLYLDSLRDAIPKNSVVMPIPLHWKRERSRGFNQSELLAAHIAHTYGLPLATRNLVRIKPTLPQAELDDWEQRKENIHGSFSIKNTHEVTQKNILLVDDIFTSGATMNEAAHVLKSAGAKRILALVIAKAK